MEKINVGIIGTGNIGCDLLVKIQKSKYLNCALFMGRNLNSRGMQFANNMGINISDKSIDALIENPNICDIVFDATTATSHIKHAKILKDLGKYAIDLTPSLIGKMCIPGINGEECLNEDNINMITCGGQATVPIACALTKCYPNIKYIEIVASIASKSAGEGTRDNIDEFTQTTKKALINFSKCNNAKALIIINPAEPPIIMNNTVYAMIDNPDLDLLTREIKKVEVEIQKYVPGYHIKFGPIYKDGIVTVMLQVTGQGDFLAPYAGNLDIITSAAVNMAERYAKKLKKGAANEEKN